MKLDLQNTPVNSSQEILRKVPGLFIGQHAGGGKAEQIFLRGFDVDHGTDVSVNIDGMPVNMVSHAHGQGYADLHFVIPETVEKIDFGKGTYYANKGDFATAGYVAFQTKDKIEKSANDIILTQIFECEKNIHTININYTNDLKKLNLSNFFSIDRIKKDINNIESSKIFEEYKDIEKIYFENLNHQIENIESYINKLEPSKNLDIEKIEIYRYRLDNLNTELKEIKKFTL